MKKFITISIQTFITFTFCFIVFCQGPAVAQTPNESIRKGVLPTQMYDTRSLSMANSTIADLFGMTSIGINAALSGLFNKPSYIQINSNHNWESNFMQHDLTLPTLTFGPHHITTRVGFLHQGFGFLPFTISSPFPDPDLMMFRGEIAYAIALSNNLSLGTLQSVSYTTGKDAEYWNYFADLGLIYAPDGPISYGMVLRGLGRETKYEIIGTGQTTLGTRVARQILELGATFRYPIEERTYLSISFANEKRFGQDGLWYKGGIEIIPFSYISIRAGAMVNFDQSDFIPRIGLGINTGVLQIDYMMAPKDLTGENFHQIGLTFQF